MALTKIGDAGMPAGAVLQVVSATKTDKQSTTSATPSDVTGLSVSITPTSTSSKILVMTNINYGGANNFYGAFFVKRNSTDIVLSTVGTGNQINSTFGVGGDSSDAAFKLEGIAHSYIDSPATTSAVTYKVQFASTWTSIALIVNGTGSTNDAAYIVGGTSTITVMEIAG